MRQRDQQREYENGLNRKYMKLVVEQDERDKNEQKEAERKAAEKRMAVKRFQLMQINGEAIAPQFNNLFGEDQNGAGGAKGALSPRSAGSINPRRVAKNAPGMSIEELRLNKALLKEISQRKK